MLTSPSEAFISRTSKHSGPIKSLQFNPYKHELLATAGAKGELFISDLDHISNPFRLGTTARAEDFETVDWNKKVPHILATGSSGGFVTVWDVKAKKESLTLNHYGRKPVSAVAWDPNTSTKLLTAIPQDQDPLILMWDLRNTNTPERILKGHDQGVLSLSWCQQDSELLLSCGKDNRTICWNPLTGHRYGEFPLVMNWTFQTRWNPHNPNILATASFDGKIAIQTIQNTKAEANQKGAGNDQALDGEDFFSKAQTQPQGTAFSLPKPPKWLERPTGVSFGFGGKVVKFGPVDGQSRNSKVSISTFAVDSGIGAATTKFEDALKGGDLSSICRSRIEEAKSDEEKADWTAIQTLISQNPRQHLLRYLGFDNMSEEASNKPGGADDEPEFAQRNGTANAEQKRSSSTFFDNSTDGDSFLAHLAASKGARTNNPFSIYSGSETDAEKQITRALMVGAFEKALDICLKENRMSDAFMIAICGGQKCIDKAQTAYFTKKSDGPNYLRLLASVVGKNLWDIVYNADLANWKEVMATLCTYADQAEFPDLCEALGDRLEEASKYDEATNVQRRDASFCFLAGSKLEKVVAIWLQELEEAEKTELERTEDDNSFSVHARLLQQFVEKVAVFREATKFRDLHIQEASEWKLAPLYAKYTEYADIAAAHGQLEIAEKYLDLLPAKFPEADVARNRVKEATKKPAPRAPAVVKNVSRSQQNTPGLQTTHTLPAATRPVGPTQYPPQSSTSPAPQQATNPYGPTGLNAYAPTGYQQQPQNAHPGPSMQTSPPYNMAYPPPREMFNPNRSTPQSAPPPPKAKDMGAWNDTPDLGNRAPISRRATPGVGGQAIGSPFTNQPSVSSPPPVGIPPQLPQQRPTPPLPPPPKAGAGPSRLSSPPQVDIGQSVQSERQPSTTPNPYAPRSLPKDTVSASRPPTIPRGASPYNPPPPSGFPPSNRYAPAPAPASQPTQMQSNPTAPPVGGTRQQAPPPNPYAIRQMPQVSSMPPQQVFQQAPPHGAMPRPQQQGPRAQAPPLGPPQGPSSAAAPQSRPSTAQSQRAASPAQPKYRKYAHNTILPSQR